MIFTLLRLNRMWSNFIAAQSMGLDRSRGLSIELQRALAGQHEKYDLQHVRDELNTPQMRDKIEKIQATVQRMEGYFKNRPHNGQK